MKIMPTWLYLVRNYTIFHINAMDGLVADSRPHTDRWMYVIWNKAFFNSVCFFCVFVVFVSLVLSEYWQQLVLCAVPWGRCHTQQSTVSLITQSLIQWTVGVSAAETKSIFSWPFAQKTFIAQLRYNSCRFCTLCFYMTCFSVTLSINFAGKIWMKLQCDYSGSFSDTECKRVV